MNFPEKKDLVFEYSNYLLSCKKSEKHKHPFLRKNAELTDGQTDGQKDNGDFIGASKERGSNKKLNAGI